MRCPPVQSIEVDGHVWQLKLSDRPSAVPSGKRGADADGGGADADGDANDDETKLVVRNVPFEASVKELRELFKYVLRKRSCFINASHTLGR